MQSVSPSALPDSERLIVESILSTDSETDHQAADPVIARFRAALESVQTSELERLYRRLPELDDHSRQVIWQFADCLVLNMLRPPLECLRDESDYGIAACTSRSTPATVSADAISLLSLLLEFRIACQSPGRSYPAGRRRRGHESAVSTSEWRL